jgi:hypothetical protein
MRLQFRIRTLLVAVVVVAICLGALRYPSAASASLLFTMAVALMLAAVLKAVASQGERRLPWIGFCLFGFGFLRVSFNLPLSDFAPHGYLPPPEPVLSAALVELSRFVNPEVRTVIEQESSAQPVPPFEAARFGRAAYINCCGSIGSLVMALIGGLFGHWLSLQSRVARTPDS